MSSMNVVAILLLGFMFVLLLGGVLGFIILAARGLFRSQQRDISPAPPSDRL